MNPERWAEVRALFEALRSKTKTHREAALAETAAMDPELADLIRHMLRGDASNERLAGDASVELADVIESAAPQIAQDDLVIDRYEIAERLGEGGMGVVYAARRNDGTFDRSVAIKVLKRGMATDLFLNRFRTERAVLARLDHPNIASLLDGGSTQDGRPYLAMERVDGQPIRAYCETHDLDLRGRLKLFLAVCDAVAHAHGQLVLHRDLKPSNIYVTNTGQVKLLDFGIAKILDPDQSDVTMTGERLLTPRYASPELIAGELLSTSSDVYSLGVVLYEVLTGTEPFEVSTPSPRAYAEAVRSQLPQAPSVVLARRESTTPADGSPASRIRSRTLRGDLDVILLTALRREPERRYTTVNALADDLRAYLDGRPVAARPESAWYRASKLVRRHPWQSSVLVTAVVGLVTATAYSMAQRNTAEKASEYAAYRLAEYERQKSIADGVIEFFSERVLGQADSANSGVPEQTISQALEKAAEGIEGAFADEPLVEAQIRRSIAYYYEQRTQPWLAEPHYKRSLELYAQEFPPEAREHFEAKRLYASCVRGLGRTEEALGLFHDVLEGHQRAGGEIGELDLAMAESQIGGCLSDLGRYEEAEPHLRKGYELRLEVLGERADNTLTSLNNLSAMYLRAGRAAEAKPLLERLVEGRIANNGPTHRRTLIARGNLATAFFRLEDHDEARRRMEAIRADQLAVLGHADGHTVHVLKQLITLAQLQEQQADEQRLQRELIGALTERFGPDHEQTKGAVSRLQELAD